MRIVNALADRLLGRVVPLATARADNCSCYCNSEKCRWCCERPNGDTTCYYNGC
ncbi:hypothetical protein [Actinorhabdospora filicis]|uniref:hypothetical protein n=1 Tax=Actinorhabdospora filicis TaxID=1785913 RepID=UPI002553569D|nr:hypothetical protein [Actinorhabdospora filicis]